MLNQPQTIIGWDVGGAHLKAVLLDPDGVVLSAIQLACPLWRGVDKLQQAVGQILSQVLSEFDVLPQHHAVTMTGELADIFADRNSGVLEIADVMCQILPGKVTFYAGNTGFVAIADVAYNTADIASANWLASAAFVAQQVEQGLFIDIGSTTADFVLLADAQPQPRGLSDAARMQLDELVYTGVVRTPLMAISSRMPFAGEWVNIAAEHFATTADIYRLTGELYEAADMADTADGAGKSLEESARRLARMVGCDLGDAPISAWIGLSGAFRQTQLNQLNNAAMRCLSRNLIRGNAPVIGAGAGSFLAKAIASQLNRPYLDIASLIQSESDAITQMAAVCLPAYAVARLSLPGNLSTVTPTINITI
ncbi:MAG TPA: hydantoinase/oxoprolinase family protein [Methylophilaceae bacterium]|nr:hydantoinase/oxoprolinase family protein [Methylophilaceae bacterium]